MLCKDIAHKNSIFEILGERRESFFDRPSTGTVMLNTRYWACGVSNTPDPCCRYCRTKRGHHPSSDAGSADCPWRLFRPSISGMESPFRGGGGRGVCCRYILPVHIE